MKIPPIIILLIFIIFSYTGCDESGGRTPESKQNKNRQKLVAAFVKQQSLYYENLQTETISLKSATSDYCKNINQGDRSHVQKKWKMAFASWVQAQWIFQGPVDTDDRYHRFEAWPSADTAKVKQSIAQLLITQEIDESRIRGRPVQAQGFPAMEYLLFSPDIDSITQQQCDALKAISSNISTMSKDVKTEWISYKTELLNPAIGETFENSEAALRFFANQFLNLVIVTKDKKLGNPLGFQKGTGELGNPKPTSGKAWMSRQSLPVLLTVFQTLNQLYFGNNSYSINDFLKSRNKKEVAKRIGEKLTLFIEQIEPLISEGITLYDNPDDIRLQSLYQKVGELEAALKIDLLPGIGVFSTFNFNDGD